VRLKLKDLCEIDGTWLPGIPPAGYSAFLCRFPGSQGIPTLLGLLN
jgi:hypothetical protein